MLQNLMGALLQGGSGSSGGSDALSQAVGGLLGGGQSGAPVGQLLNGLEQVIGGNPTSGQLSQGQGSALPANSPVMSLLGPLANAVAAKAGISPAVATTVAGVAMHYLLSSHPAAGGSAPLNLGSTMQQMASTGGVSADTLNSSGMVNSVVQATGLSPQAATQSLNAAFSHMATHVDRKAAKQAASARRDARRDN